LCFQAFEARPWENWGEQLPDPLANLAAASTSWISSGRWSAPRWLQADASPWPTLKAASGTAGEACALAERQQPGTTSAPKTSQKFVIYGTFVFISFK